MSNMSYCRFQNTTPDLQDCYEYLSEVLAYENDPEASSNDKAELRSAKRLIELCKDIASEYGDMDYVD